AVKKGVEIAGSHLATTKASIVLSNKEAELMENLKKEKVEYGDDDYSEIKLEYDVDKKLERLQPGKDLVLQIFADNKTREEGNILVIPQSWNAKKTVLQDIKDKSNEGIKNIGDKTGNKDKYLLEINLPGVKKEDVKIEVEENIIRVSGERKEEKKQDDAKQHYSEIFYGKFYREFVLPTLVKKEKVKANYENGVLTITAFKDSQSHAHQVNIDGFPIIVEINEIDFPTGKGDEKAKITKISFTGNESVKGVFEANKTYQMTFDDQDVEDDRQPTMTQNTASAGGFAFGPGDKLPNHLVLESDNDLRVVYHNKDKLQIAEQSSQGSQSGESGEGPTETKDTGNRKDNSEDTSNSNQGNDNDNQTPPPNNQPTQEEINENREKLNQAAQGSDKEKISDSIEKNEELKDKGAKQSEEDKAAEEAARKKLAEDKKKYQETIAKTIKNRLEANGVKKDELSTEANTNLEKLEGEEIIEPSQVDAAEKIIVEDTYKKAAEKKLTDLENKVNQATKSKNEKELKKLKQMLSQFIDNANYQSKKSEAESLIKKIENTLKQSSNSSESKGNKNDIP
ncbi:9233_t:CDS:2, partial [Paraglomus occultum]